MDEASAREAAPARLEWAGSSCSATGVILHQQKRPRWKKLPWEVPAALIRELGKDPSPLAATVPVPAKRGTSKGNSGSTREAARTQGWDVRGDMVLGGACG